MKTTTSQNCPIYWHQGLLLQPHHFQLESRFHQVNLNHLIQVLHNEPWGVLAITLHEAALLEKKLVISHGEFLFPDGSQCHIPNNAALLSRPFDEAWVEAGRLFVVYLGLKRWQTHENVAEYDDQQAHTVPQERRLLVPLSPSTVPDSYANGVDGQVRLLKYQLRIFWHNELEHAGDYMVMPVASLERDGPRIVLNEYFVPPLLNVHDWPYLHHLLADIKDQVVSRARQLENFKQSSQSDEPLDISLMLALQALARSAYSIQRLMETPQLHPRQAWETLSAMVAELSYLVCDLSVAGEEGLDRWPAYDHLNLSTVFKRLIEQVKQALNSIVVGPEYTLQLQREGAIWHAELPKRALSGQFHYWLAFCGVGSTTLASGFECLVKLAAYQMLTTLLNRSVSGIALTPQVSKPTGLPRLTDGVYCAIDTQSELWHQVTQSGQIGLFWQAPEQAQALLYVTRD